MKNKIIIDFFFFKERIGKIKLELNFPREAGKDRKDRCPQPHVVVVPERDQRKGLKFF